MGGTFDPVHNGHLRIALDVVEQLGCERLSLLPCADPPHGKTPLADAQQRSQLLELAVEGVTELQVDKRELQRGGESYTVDTLRELREENPEAALCWVMGGDSFASLRSWSRWEEIFTLTHLVVCQRPEAVFFDGLEPALQSEWQARATTDVSELRQVLAGKILPVTPTQLSISATEIRRRLQEGRSVRYLVPTAVANWLEEQPAYK